MPRRRLSRIMVRAAPWCSRSGRRVPIGVDPWNGMPVRQPPPRPRKRDNWSRFVSLQVSAGARGSPCVPRATSCHPTQLTARQSLRAGGGYCLLISRFLVRFLRGAPTYAVCSRDVVPFSKPIPIIDDERTRRSAGVPTGSGARVARVPLSRAQARAHGQALSRLRRCSAVLDALLRASERAGLAIEPRARVSSRTPAGSRDSTSNGRGRAERWWGGRRRQRYDLDAEHLWRLGPNVRA